MSFAVLASRSHPALRRSRKLAAATWAAYPHVIVQTGHGGGSIVGSAVARAGLGRRIGLVVPTFLAALVAVAETDLFFTAPRELVRPLLERFDLVALEPPVAVPVVPLSALWHERYHADAAHEFLRRLVERELSAMLRMGAVTRAGR